MSKTAIIYGLEARLALKAGVDVVANVVKCTMGPGGRSVAYKPPLGPVRITHDGVSAAGGIRLGNGFVQVGADIAIEACRLTNTTAGDGTTTAAVLTQAITDAAHRMVAAGVDPMRLRYGIAAAVGRVDQLLREQTKSVQTFERIVEVAGLSADDMEIGEIVANIFRRHGPGAAISVIASHRMDVEVHTIDGMRVARGLASPHLSTDNMRIRAELDSCDVLVTDRDLDCVDQLLPFLEAYVASGGERLLVVAKTIGGDVLPTLVENHARRRVSTIAVRAPAFGKRQREVLEDIAIFTGATLVAHEAGQGWPSVPLGVLGKAARVRSDARETIIVNGGGEPQAITHRSEILWHEHARAKNQFDREKLEERIRNLSGAISEVQVGASTEVERVELQHRVEDAIAATRAALDDGVVAGGGSALARAAREIAPPPGTHPDEAAGWTAVATSMTVPLARIAHNAGFDGAVSVYEVMRRSEPHVLDVRSGDYVDPMVVGLVDPARAVRAALRYAASAAVMIITANTVISDASSYREWARDICPRLVREAGVLLAE